MVMTAAGAVAFAYAVMVVVFALSCPAMLTRPENVVYLGIGIVASIVVMAVGLRRAGGPWLVAAAGSAGLIAGLWLQPSTGALVSVAVAIGAVIELRRAASLSSLLVGVVILILGILSGHQIQSALSGAVRC